MNHSLIKLPLLVLALIGASACGMKTVRSESSVTEESATAPATPTPAEELQIQLKPASHAPRLQEQVVHDKPQEKATTTSHNPGHGHAHAPQVASIEPAQSLRWLRNGNTRFVKGFLRKDGQSAQDVKRLSKGQKPHAIILSCSDSRVPPEVVFDQKLGELFVVRTAGEALDPNAIGSIEYAVEHLHSRLIVVMGHTSCGAVKAAIQTLDGGDAGSPSLNHLVADLHPRIRALVEQGHRTDNVAPESWANARGVAADLIARSTILKNAVEKGHLVIRPALYELESGKVKFD